MTIEADVRTLVLNWLNKSQEAEEGANVLLEHQMWSAGVSRLYYAVFYAVSALLALRKSSFGKHSAVRASLHRDFIKTGILPIEAGMIYNRLFEWRQKADYDAFLEIDKEMAYDLLQQAGHVLKIFRQQAELELKEGED